MDFDYNTTLGKYTEYVIATQGTWPIYGKLLIILLLLRLY